MPPKQLSVDDLQDEDLYNFLEIGEKANNKQIEKAYRKLALKWHPDKNPDNPEAAELFRKLVKITELLKDKEARSAYDQLRRGRRLQEERRNQLNSERRKLREDLERREAAANEDVVSARQARESLAAKINRLKEEGAALIRASEESLREEWQQAKSAESTVAADSAESTVAADSAEDVSGTVKVRWDKSNPLTEDAVRESLNKFGPIAMVIMSKKGGRAVVEFDSPSSAASAVRTGYPGMTLSSPAGEAAAAQPAMHKAPSPSTYSASFQSTSTSQPPSCPQARSAVESTVPAAKRKLSEAEVFAMMRAAQKRKDESGS